MDNNILLASVEPLQVSSSSSTSSETTSSTTKATKTTSAYKAKLSSQTTTFSFIATTTHSASPSRKDSAIQYKNQTSYSAGQIEGKDYGHTLTSAQVAGIAMGVVGTACLVFCAYRLIKYIRNKRRKKTSSIESFHYDHEAAPVPSYSSTNYSPTPNATNTNQYATFGKKQAARLENNSKEDVYYGLCYTDGFTDNGGYHLSPSHRERSPSPAKAHRKIFMQQFGQPGQHNYYATLPLPTPENGHGTQSRELYRASSPTMPLSSANTY